MDDYVRVATPLLCLIASLPQSENVSDSLFFQEKIIVQLQRFSQKISAAGGSEKDKRVAHYWLCATLDEAILRETWGGQSLWHQQPLLIKLFNDGRGGEVFYELLTEELTLPTPNQHLLFLAYILLQAGFTGKYSSGDVEERGRIMLTLQHRLGLVMDRPHYPNLFIEHSSEIVDRLRPKKCFLKYASIVFGVIVLMNILGNVVIAQTSKELKMMLSVLRLDGFIKGGAAGGHHDLG
jgi:type IV/VI secretion system ImpK/VasF family protein